MKKLKEDIVPELGFEGMTIEDLYDQFGADLFSDENIPYLKSAGLIDENGYPIKHYTDWEGEEREEPYSLEDLCELNSYFIKSPYIKQLLLKEILKTAPEDKVDKADDSVSAIVFEVKADDFHNIRNFSSEFLDSCFTGEGLWEYFDYQDNYDLNYLIPSDFPSTEEAGLDKLGFPEGILERVADDGLTEEDEELPQAEYYDELKLAMELAARDAYAMGCESQCQNAYDRAFAESLPDGCVEDTQQRTEKRILKLDITDVKTLNAILDCLWADAEYYGFDYWGLKDEIASMTRYGMEVNFREPGYGWSDFDSNCFREGAVDRIREIDFSGLQPKQEEADLLNYDGETNEYHEDVQLRPTRNKKQKLYYRYAEYTPELSKTAYILDEQGLSDLFNWSETHNKELHYELWRIIDENDFNVEDGYIVISKIKPSQKSEYDRSNYSVWLVGDSIYDDHRWLSYIPDDVAHRLISGRALDEDIELDVVPVPSSLQDYLFRKDSSETDFLMHLIEVYGEKALWYNRGGFSSKASDFHTTFKNLEYAAEQDSRRDTFMWFIIPDQECADYINDYYSMNYSPFDEVCVLSSLPKRHDEEDLSEDLEPAEEWDYYEVWIMSRNKYAEIMTADGDPTMEVNESVYIRVPHSLFISGSEEERQQVEDYLKATGRIDRNYMVIYISSPDTEDFLRYIYGMDEEEWRDYENDNFRSLDIYDYIPPEGYAETTVGD